jgi:hypothetical protein
VAGDFRIVARVGSQVRKSRHPTLEAALAALDEQLNHVSPQPGRQVLGRDYEPVRQVAGRFELRGPGGARGGLDVRGDGSAEAYTGWIRKRIVPRRQGETAVDALGRVLLGGADEAASVEEDPL